MASSTTTATTTANTANMSAETVLRLFPEIDTSSEALQGHDEEQIRLMDEVCIVTDANDMPIGKASKKICSSHHCHHIQRSATNSSARQATS